MQFKNSLKNKLVYCLGTAMLLSPLALFAKEVNLYDQPNANAKIVSKIDLAAGVIPIFTPQPGDWMKVGDPNNGNTGWVKTADVKNVKGSVSFSQQIYSDASGPGIQVFQFGNPKQLSAEEQQKFMKDMESRQQAMRQTMQHEIEEMNRHFAAMQEFAWPHFWNDAPAVVFVPVKDGPAKQADAKPITSKPSVNKPITSKS